MCYGLTLKDTAALYAVALWKENQCAGIIWIYLFRQRHNNISLRTPEAKNLDRATNFNKTHVTFFLKNLKEVIEKHNLTALQIYNYDETGVTNVHKPPKILAPKHQKRVGKVISAKRGVLVTMKNFKVHMLTGAPTGSSGAAYPTVWMTEDNFLEFINHLIKIVPC
ncbi:hypothetical protein ILUMI_13845 [Ignelater luminosus]|uniref:Uncharacterized protein n=1 Tax=Ignelater luminosus TaxID=2038154 RepID=A0A8K0CXQ0_IGNLU|nr:hypothetical protein ILUMI_13845 [Ignelater luminosus]